MNRHGTRAEYVAHRKRGETPCEDCRAANAAYRLSRLPAATPLLPHGTRAAYRRHLRGGTVPCEACLAANAAATRARKPR